METNQKKPGSSGFKKWLDLLQQESWQLELLISGFAIFGLINALDPVLKESMKVRIFETNQLYALVLSVLSSSIAILIAILTFHVILRGLWIGTLGLRYVSGDIDYEGLHYTEKFTAYLKRKVGSFDAYISRLENICSTLFALAFVMVFFNMSFFLVIGVTTVIGNAFMEIPWYSEATGKSLRIGWTILFLILAFIYFIDFITGGWLKRNKFLSKLYFPIYKLFGICTLSFLYRPVVYNFLDQKKAKWLAIFIIPGYFLIGFLLSSFGKTKSNYLVEDQETSATFANKLNYQDMMTEETDIVEFASIPSKIIKQSYLPIFLAFTGFKEEAIFNKDTTLVPKKDRRGFDFQFHRGSGRPVSIDDIAYTSIKDQKRYLSVLEKLYEFRVDSLLYRERFIVSTDNKELMGFETVLDLEGLPRGKHDLHIIGPQLGPKDSIVIDTIRTIPFWYFPN